MVATCANVSKKTAFFEMAGELTLCRVRNKKNFKIRFFVFEYLRKRVENRTLYQTIRCYYSSILKVFVVKHQMNNRKL